jgi:hypothetical protein
MNLIIELQNPQYDKKMTRRKRKKKKKPPSFSIIDRKAVRK